jgi:flagellar export protein FliJ
MKRFRFSLEAVRTLRESAAAKAMESYARAVRAQSDAETALRAATDAVAKHVEGWRKAMTRGFRPADILGMEHAREALEKRRSECVQALREAAAAAAKAQAELQLAQQNSDVVERFHDRKRHEFNLAALKEEQHFLDELANTRRGPGPFQSEAAYA